MRRRRRWRRPRGRRGRLASDLQQHGQRQSVRRRRQRLRAEALPGWPRRRHLHPRCADRRCRHPGRQRDGRRRRRRRGRHLQRRSVRRPPAQHDPGREPGRQPRDRLRRQHRAGGIQPAGRPGWLPHRRVARRRPQHHRPGSWPAAVGPLRRPDPDPRAGFHQPGTRRRQLHRPAERRNHRGSARDRPAARPRLRHRRVRDPECASLPACGAAISAGTRRSPG